MPKSLTPPRSASKPALLSNGSDATLRRALYDLMAVSSMIQMTRREFAGKIGIAPSQYLIVRVVADRHRHGGVTVSEIKDVLHLHNSFVVLQAGLLVKQGILRRKPNPRDKRSHFLHLSKKGEALVASIGPAVVLTNDAFWGWMSKRDFERFAMVIATMAELGPAVLSMLKLALASSVQARRGRTSPLAQHDGQDEQPWRTR